LILNKEQPPMGCCINALLQKKDILLALLFIKRFNEGKKLTNNFLRCHTGRCAESVAKIKNFPERGKSPHPDNQNFFERLFTHAGRFRASAYCYIKTHAFY